MIYNNDKYHLNNKPIEIDNRIGPNIVKADTLLKIFIKINPSLRNSSPYRFEVK